MSPLLSKKLFTTTLINDKWTLFLLKQILERVIVYIPIWKLPKFWIVVFFLFMISFVSSLKILLNLHFFFSGFSLCFRSFDDHLNRCNFNFEDISFSVVLFLLSVSYLTLFPQTLQCTVYYLIVGIMSYRVVSLLPTWTCPPNKRDLESKE